MLLLGNLSQALDKPNLDLLNKYCSKCHNPKKAKADLDLSILSSDINSPDHFEKWRMIYDKMKYLEMPPEDAKELPEENRKSLLEALRNEFLSAQKPGKVNDQKLLLPEFGNYVDHDALFKSKPKVVIPATPSIWRLRPELYDSFANTVANRPQGLSQPFTLMPGFSFKDYSSPYYIDEPTTELLLKNAELLVENQISYKLDKNNVKKGKFQEFVVITDSDRPPFEEDIHKAIKKSFLISLQRMPNANEVKKFSALWQKIKNNSDHVTASKSMLMAILMQPEVLFRLELGNGPVDQYGRQRLSQIEIAKSISFALGNKIDNVLLQAAQRGLLKSKQDIESHIRKVLENKKFQLTRLLKFFEEYFGYKRAIDVFKDQPKRGKHEPKILVADLEFLIQDVVQKDRNVLYELLTTNKYYVNYRFDSKRKTASRMYNKGVFETVYGLPADWKWTDKQPIELPKDERAGVLTHPAWLVAWSDNFHNDPIRRGKWIRTHLLGGTVPDVPITVEAILPEDEKLTLRKRLHMATDKAQCKSCHSRMNDLGLPFEMYTHYGLYRKLEVNEDVQTSGLIKYSGEPSLEGAVSSPIKMIHKLAKSTKVEQVFIRHVFRYFLGRNETLGDALTLQNAHRIYKAKNGSYKELIISLLTSDSFLYRMKDNKGSQP